MGPLLGHQFGPSIRPPEPRTSCAACQIAQTGHQIFESVAPPKKTRWHVHGLLKADNSDDYREELAKERSETERLFILTVLARKEAAEGKRGGGRSSAAANMQLPAEMKAKQTSLVPHSAAPERKIERRAGWRRCAGQSQKLSNRLIGFLRANREAGRLVSGVGGAAKRAHNSVGFESGISSIYGNGGDVGETGS